MPADLATARNLLTSTCGFGVISAEQMRRDAGLTAEQIDALDAADLIREIPSRRVFLPGRAVVLRTYRVFL